MVAVDEDDRETPRLPASDAVLATTLAGIRATLSARPPDPHRRALLAKVESYERVMDRWDTIPPGEAQRAALTDLVEELRAAVDDDEPPPSSVRLGRLALKSKPPK